MFASENMRKVAKKEQIIHRPTQPKNLKKQLTRAKFDMNEQEFNIKVCGDSRCGICSRDNFNYLETGNTKIFRNGKQFSVRSNMTCKTKT